MGEAGDEGRCGETREDGDAERVEWSCSRRSLWLPVAPCKMPWSGPPEGCPEVGGWEPL